MKKRTAVIGVLLSLLPVGQPLLLGTGVVVMLSASNEAQAESASFYYNRAINQSNDGDHYGAISDYTKVIKINPHDAIAYKNRGIAKEKLGDMQGACSDWRKASSLGKKDTAEWIRDQCE